MIYIYNINMICADVCVYIYIRNEYDFQQSFTGLGAPSGGSEPGRPVAGVGEATRRSLVLCFCALR